MSALDNFLTELNEAKSEPETLETARRLLEALDVARPEGPLADWFAQASDWTWRDEAPALGETKEIALRIAAHYLAAHLVEVRHRALCEAIHLTPREGQALLCVAQGLNSKAAARKMGAMPKTVDLHVEAARKKLGAATRVEAVAKALKLGLITMSRTDT